MSKNGQQFEDWITLDGKCYTLLLGIKVKTITDLVTRAAIIPIIAILTFGSRSRSQKWSQTANFSAAQPHIEWTSGSQLPIVYVFNNN